MSNPVIERKIRFSREDPSRYDYVEGLHTRAAFEQYESLGFHLSTADIKISQASEYSAKIVRNLLPIIVAEQEVKTVEFISYNRWKKSPDEIRTLRGVILRNEDGTVLLYVYGVSLGGSEPGNLDWFILETLGVSNDKQKEIYNETWPHINYSVVIELL